MQKLDSAEDLRARRTHKLLEQAFIEGVMEKGFEALTVRDITKRAMVNRSTFYRHYLDKYDLLEQHVNAIYEGLEEHGRMGGPEGREGLIEIFKQLQQFSGFYRLVLNSQTATFFSPDFRQKTQKRCRANFQKMYPETSADTGSETPPLNMKFATLTSAANGGLVWWLEQERPSSPELFIQWMQQLINSIVTPPPALAQQVD